MQDLPPPSFLRRAGREAIAYRTVEGKPPGVMFLGGFMSDMTGTKATALEAHCRGAGRAFVRFDYSGHGESGGAFRDGTIGAWRDDALAVLDGVARGPQVLVGSSMGGWVMLLVALARPERVAGLVGIAAAPDFTEDLIWSTLDDETRQRLTETGAIELPCDYDDDPYPITMGLIEEARSHLLLHAPIPLDCPIHLLQGMVRRGCALADRLAHRRAGEERERRGRAGQGRRPPPLAGARPWPSVQGLGDRGTRRRGFKSW